MFFLCLSLSADSHSCLFWARACWRALGFSSRFSLEKLLTGFLSVGLRLLPLTTSAASHSFINTHASLAAHCLPGIYACVCVRARPVTDLECLAPVATVGKSQMLEKLDFSYVIGSCWPGQEVLQPLSSSPPPSPDKSGRLLFPV